MEKRRVFLIILDSFGIGYEPDAFEYGDEGADTLRTVYKSDKFKADNLKRLGLFNIDGVEIGEKEEKPIASFARLREASNAKDTTTGHWEIAGIISKKAMPTYPDGFLDYIIEEFSKRTKRKVICNKPYSGTDVIRDYADEHIKTGALIVYTSADSVFQIAAHEEIVPVDELYRYCEIAREILSGDDAVGRVIARPFIGRSKEYKRTSNRHDYSLLPPKDTMLDILMANGYDTYAVGKIYDIFAKKGISYSVRSTNNSEGMDIAIDLLNKDFNGICFVNLVDFDMIYGHRNDIDGYANAIAEFDGKLSEFIKGMRDRDILMISADHGCDPGYKGTDHTREYVPLLVYGKDIKAGIDMKTRESFSDIAATILDIFNIKGDIDGKSFKELLFNK